MYIPTKEASVFLPHVDSSSEQFSTFLLMMVLNEHDYNKVANSILLQGFLSFCGSYLKGKHGFINIDPSLDKG